MSRARSAESLDCATFSSTATRFPVPVERSAARGEINREKPDILRPSDEVFIEEIRRAALYDDIWQAFAVILPVKSVGVIRDGRIPATTRWHDVPSHRPAA